MNTYKEILKKATWCWEIHNIQRQRGQFIMFTLAIVFLILQFDSSIPNILEVLKINITIAPLNMYVKLILFLISGNIIWQILLSIKDNKRTIMEEILLDIVHNKYKNYDKEIKDFFINYQNQRDIIDFTLMKINKTKNKSDYIINDLLDKLSVENYIEFCISIEELYKRIEVKNNDISMFMINMNNAKQNVICHHPHYIFLQKELLHKNLDDKIEQKNISKKVVKI